MQVAGIDGLYRARDPTSIWFRARARHNGIVDASYTSIDSSLQATAWHIQPSKPVRATGHIPRMKSSVFTIEPGATLCTTEK